MDQSPAVERLTPHQRRLFVFLGVACFFEGWDYFAITQTCRTCGPNGVCRSPRAR